MKQQVLQDTGATLKISFDERPSSCTAAIYDDCGNVVTASGIVSVSLGSSWTVSGECGYSQSDRNQLSLAPEITDLEWLHTYRVSNQDGQHEYVKLLKIPTDTRLCQTSEELQYDYETGDTVEDTTVSITIDPSEVDTFGRNYRARLYALFSDGTNETKDLLFDVVVHKTEQPITPQNLASFDPLLHREVPVESLGTDWSEILDKTWEAVCNDLIDQGWQPDQVIDEQQLEELHYYRLKLRLAEIGIEPKVTYIPGGALQYFNAKYQAKLKTVAINWLDKTEDLVQDSSEKVDPQRRLII